MVLMFGHPLTQTSKWRRLFGVVIDFVYYSLSSKTILKLFPKHLRTVGTTFELTILREISIQKFYLTNVERPYNPARDWWPNTALSVCREQNFIKIMFSLILYCSILFIALQNKFSFAYFTINANYISKWIILCKYRNSNEQLPTFQYNQLNALSIQSKHWNIGKLFYFIYLYKQKLIDCINQYSFQYISFKNILKTCCSYQINWNSPTKTKLISILFIQTAYK